MVDLVSFLIKLGCNDEEWQAYDTNPDAYIDNSDLSQEDKNLMKTQNASLINGAIATRGAEGRVEMFEAGNVRAGITLRREPSNPGQ